MRSKETTIRVVRTAWFRTKEQPIEAPLKVETAATEYEVPLDAGKHANVFPKYHLLTWFLDLHLRVTLTLGNEMNVRHVSSTSFVSLAKHVHQPSQVAETLHERADKVLKGMSEEIEKISSVTAYIKPVMDYALAASEVGMDLPYFWKY